MEATVIRAFRGKPDGDVHVRQFERGDKVHGELARVAMAEGWATTGKAPLENKAAAPSETKSGSASPPARRSRKSKSISSGVGRGSASSTTTTD